MANNKFNLSKGEEKKGFNLSKNDGAASKFNLSKEQASNTATISGGNSKPEKKSKWRLWLLLVIIAIVVVIFLVRKCSTKGNDAANESTPAQVEQPATVTEQAPAAKEKAVAPTLAAEDTDKPASEETLEPATSEQPTTKPAESVTTPAQSVQPATVKPAASPTLSVLPQGTLEEKVQKVIRGDFGNGEDRKRALGSEYKEIQRKVNEMYRNGNVY
ncbi:MAG: hypothetical protein LBG96_03365 [Tannerella sp.]|jgi:cytoskeletal protein RodZ|nr:hypothetical protein [Tannerella sp.]